MNSKTQNIVTILNSAPQDYENSIGLSGGDRILFESIKEWKNLFSSIGIITCNSGKKAVEKYMDSTHGLDFYIVQTPKFLYKNLFLLFLYKTFKASLLAWKMQFRENTYLFSSSDIFPDAITGFFAKLKHKDKIKWVAALYFFASSPFSKDFPYKGFAQRIRGSIYYFTQKICYYLIREKADYVVACNELDKKVFIKDGYSANNICTIYGGVDLSIPQSVPEPKQKEYDAVFMARFHPQKGPLIAVKAWNEVVKVKKDVKLAMIGNGPEEEIVTTFIKQNNLENNIVLLGFMDGVEKYKVLKSAKIFLHTSVYETGGMAAAEGMAANLPVIAFDHEGFDYCYPKGILRVAPVGDFNKIAEGILRLLDNKEEYQKVKLEAMDLVKQWDWKIRANYLYKSITSV